MRYTIQVCFSNLDGEFNITSSTHLSVSTSQMPTEKSDFPTLYVIIPVCVAVIIIIVLVIIIVISVLIYKRHQQTKLRKQSTCLGIGLTSRDSRTPNPDPVYADLAGTKGKNSNKAILPAPENTTVVYSELLAKEQADIIRQQLEQNSPPYKDVQISSTSFQTSITVIPPGIHGDRNVTAFIVEEGHLLSKQVVERAQNVEETFENQNSHLIPTPEDNQDDIPQTRTPVSGILLGSTEVFPNRFDEIFETSFDENGLFYHSYEYGVTIIIPPGAVQQQCILQFGACLILPHVRSNDSFIPVSPFVWIDIDKELLKPAELYIPHYVDINCGEELYLLSSEKKSSEMEEAFVFSVNTKACTSFSPTLARICTMQFCSLCIATKGENPPHKRYHLLMAEKELEDGSLHIEICIMYSFHCLKKVKEQFKEHKVSHYGPVFLNDDSRGVSVNCDPICVTGWQIGKRQGIQVEYITEDTIDFYKVLGCSPETVSVNDIEDLKMYEEMQSYPPRFKLLFSPDGSPSENTQVKLSLHGLTNEYCATVELCNKKPDSCQNNLVSPISLLKHHESLYLDTGSSAKSNNNLSDSSNDSDTFIFDLIIFLESKLELKWMKFGHSLNLSKEELHNIEIRVGQDNKRCTRQILLAWRKLNPFASWEPIAEALQKTGYMLLSSIVTRHYTNPGPRFCHSCQRTHGLDFNFTVHDVLACYPKCSTLIHNKPKVSMLIQLVSNEIPSKWELFGQQVGLEQSYLDTLHTDGNTCQVRFNRLLDEWRRWNSQDFTWFKVIEVLHSKAFREYSLIEKILRELENLNTSDKNVTQDSTTNNGLDVSKQNNDEPVHSTANNGLDVSKQNNGISLIEPSLGISASHRLKPSSNSLNSIRDGTPLVPDPDETDDSTNNNGLDVPKQNTDEPEANNGLDVSQQSIDGPVHSTTNNGLDVSKQNNDKPVHSTTNNGLDVSKQNINGSIDLTTNNGLDVSKQNKDEPVGNNGLDVSKHNNSISPIDPSLVINNPDTPSIITSSTSPKKHAIAELETRGTQDNNMKATSSPIAEDKKEDENLEIFVKKSISMMYYHYLKRHFLKCLVEKAAPTSNPTKNLDSELKDGLPMHDIKRDSLPKPISETESSRRRSIHVFPSISSIGSKLKDLATIKTEPVKTDRHDISESERHLFDPSSQEIEHETSDKPPPESQPTMTDMVVSKLQRSSLVSMVISEATNKKSASVDPEKKRLLDISSTSDIKSEPNDDYHPASPHESHSLDDRSIVVSTEPSNREDKSTTVSGMIMQQDRHEEGNE